MVAMGMPVWSESLFLLKLRTARIPIPCMSASVNPTVVSTAGVEQQPKEQREAWDQEVSKLMRGAPRVFRIVMDERWWDIDMNGYNMDGSLFRSSSKCM